jgi:hypothetical protein
MNLQQQFPVPGTILWAVEVNLEKDVFRSGAATKPGTDFLRFSDLKIPNKLGRIEGEEQSEYIVSPGQGVSLFLEKILPAGMVVVDETMRDLIDKSKQKKLHWWGIDQGHPIPSGLVLTYDGDPPGHCTLTVNRPMTVKAFLELVSLVPFSPRGYDVIGALT